MSSALSDYRKEAIKKAPWIATWHLPTDIPDTDDLTIDPDNECSQNVIIALDMDGEIRYRSGYTFTDTRTGLHQWFVWETLGMGKALLNNEKLGIIVAWITEQELFCKNLTAVLTAPKTENAGSVVPEAGIEPATKGL